MAQPIVANGPLLTVRNLAVVLTFMAAALVLGLVAARTGQAAHTATVFHPFYSWR
jgi:hypothetical protein